MESNKKRKSAEATRTTRETEEEEEDDDEEEEEEEEEAGDDGDEERGEISGDEVRALIEPFTKEQVMDILQEAAIADPKVLSKIRKMADKDPAHRKLFIRGLGWEVTADTLKSVFSRYGSIEDCSVIRDKSTGKSKGYGFVTFRHMDAARRALVEPSKTIEGRVTICQLASVGPSLPSSDHSGRKIYVGNVPQDATADSLLPVFSQYGDIEEGPIGFDKKTGKSKGYALIIYKSADSARKALKESNKVINGHTVNCKMATSDGGHSKAKHDTPELSLSQGGMGMGMGIVPSNNLQYSALSGFLPLNQGMLGQHSAFAAQGLLALNANPGLTGMSPSLHHHQASLAHQLALGSSLNSSFGPSLNSPSLGSGVSQGLSQASLSSYGLHGFYGSQVGSGASSLYSNSGGGGGPSMNSQSGQGYPSSHLGQASGSRSQSLSGYFGN